MATTESTQTHRDRISFVGIAIVVNDAVPFRYPRETDHESLSELCEAKLPNGSRMGVELNSERFRKARAQFWRMTQATFAEFFLRPDSKEFYGDNLELVVDNLRLVCFPLRAAAKQKNSPLVSFSVVLALDASYDAIVEQSRAKLRTEPTPTSYGEAYPLSLAGIRPYRTIAHDLARGLLFAENVEGYVARETKRALEEDCPTTALQDELKNIYHDLIQFGTARLRLPDGRICASFNLYDGKLRPTMALRPYHSLVMTSVEDAPSRSADDPEAPTREFATYFRNWGATKSLADATDDLGMSLEQACRFASYLRQWERARIVHKLQDWSMFQVSPSMDLRRNTSPMFARFAARFPGHDLARVLSKVTEPRPGSRVPRNLRDFTEIYGESTKSIFSWLMRNKLVVEVFQFVYFVPSAPAGGVRPASSRRSSFTAMVIADPASPSSSGSSTSPTPPFSQPTTPTTSASNQQQQQQQQPQKQSPSSKTLMEHVDGKTLTGAQLVYLKSAWDLNNGVFRMLLKLCPLFGGTNHIQEIMHRTGISLGAMKVVLEHYSDCLFVAIHELSI